MDADSRARLLAQNADPPPAAGGVVSQAATVRLYEDPPVTVMPPATVIARPIHLHLVDGDSAGERVAAAVRLAVDRHPARVSLHGGSKHDQRSHGRRAGNPKAGDGMKVGTPKGVKDPAAPAPKGKGGGKGKDGDTPENGDGGKPTVKGRVINDEAEAKEYLKRYDDWKNNLTDGEDRAMRFYQSPGYQLMNGELRGGKGSVDAPEKDLKRARQATKDLKAAIAKAPPLDEPLTVWRGMSARHFGEPMAAGQTVTDRGFTSTALYRKGVASVAESGEQVTAEIRLPAGTKAAAGSAREMVLPPDATFRVVSRKGRNVVLQYQPPTRSGKAAAGVSRFAIRDMRSPVQLKTVLPDGTEVWNGGMVAAAVPDWLALDTPGALPAMHITLRYLGDSRMFDQAARAWVVGQVDHAAAGMRPFQVRIAGWGRLGPEGATVLFVEAAELVDLYDRLQLAIPQDTPDTHPGFNPHTTVAYGPVDPALLEPLVGSEFTVTRLFTWFGSQVTPDGTITPGPGSQDRPLTAAAVVVQFHGDHNQKDHAGKGRWVRSDWEKNKDNPNMQPPWSTKGEGVKAANNARKMVDDMVKDNLRMDDSTISVWADKNVGKFPSDARDQFDYYVAMNAQRLKDTYFAVDNLKDTTPGFQKGLEDGVRQSVEHLVAKGLKLSGANLDMAAKQLGFDDATITAMRSWSVLRANSALQNMHAQAKKQKLGGEVDKGDGSAGYGDMKMKAAAAKLKADLDAQQAGGGGVTPKKPPPVGVTDMDHVDALKAKGVDMDQYDLSGIQPGKPKVPDGVDLDTAKAQWTSLNPSQKKMAEEFAHDVVAKLKAEGKDVSIANIKAKYQEISTASTDYVNSQVSKGVYALVSQQPSKFGLGGVDQELGPTPGSKAGGTAKTVTATGSKAVKTPAAPGFDNPAVAKKNALGLPVLKGTADAAKTAFPDIDANTTEAKALSAYHDGAYSQQNINLRDGGTPTSTDGALTGLINRHQVPTDVTVYRGMVLSPDAKAKIKPGATFTDHGFISTDTDGSTAKGFSGGDVFMAIHVPAGTKGVYKNNQHKEKELLLQRGTTFQVVGKIADPATGKEAWHAEVISQPTFKADGMDAKTPRYSDFDVVEKFHLWRRLRLAATA